MEIIQNDIFNPGLSITKEICAGSFCTIGIALEVKNTVLGNPIGTAFVVRDTGSVGIGTADPLAALHVMGTGLFSQNVGIGTTNPGERLQVSSGNILVKGTNNFQSDGDEAILFLGDNNHSIKSIFGSGLRISTYQAQDAITILEGNGNVGVGTSAPSAKLHVEVQSDNEKAFVVSKNGTINMRITGDGSIFARKYRATIANIPDYIFSDDYPLMSIPEFGEFIYKYRHLPDFKSAKEVEENGGVVDLGERTNQFHKLLEIYGRYLVNIDKRITELEKQNDIKDYVIKEKDEKIIMLEKENDLLKNR